MLCFNAHRMGFCKIFNKTAQILSESFPLRVYYYTVTHDYSQMVIDGYRQMVIHKRPQKAVYMSLCRESPPLYQTITGCYGVRVPIPTKVTYAGFCIGSYNFLSGFLLVRNPLILMGLCAGLHDKSPNWKCDTRCYSQSIVLYATSLCGELAPSFLLCLRDIQ